MRHLAVLLCVCVLFIQCVNAQEVTQRVSTLPTAEQLSRLQSVRQSNTEPDPSVKAAQSYFVKFTEFRYKNALDVNRTSDEIVQQSKAITKSISMKLVLIYAGSFNMGSAANC